MLILPKMGVFHVFTIMLFKTKTILSYNFYLTNHIIELVRLNQNKLE